MIRPALACAVGTLACAMLLWSGLLAAEPPATKPDEPWTRRYVGPTRSDIDASTIDGKVLCGYQGWFNCPGDGTRFGFGHWGDVKGRFGVDMWPDVSEYPAKDLAEVPHLEMPDGSPARLYSGFTKGPTLVHFQWMRQYGIDGVFLSRFIGETTGGERTRHVNQNLANVREGCHREGRVWALMLDLSLGKNATTDMVKNDWKFLCDTVGAPQDSRYLHQDKKPVVLLWGLGFNDGSHPFSADQAAELIDFFKNDPKYGGVYLIGGVDPGWRTLTAGSRKDEAWNKVYRSFDAISPWNTGRFGSINGMDNQRKNTWEPDLTELKKLNMGYMPVAFPGFSWDNMRNATPGKTMIPRLKGEFLWHQFAAFKELNVRTVFVGMFDEVNEGTAIYKVANDVPVGKYFVTYEGLPSDYYLRLTGYATKMIRGERPYSAKIPDNLPEPTK